MHLGVLYSFLPHRRASSFSAFRRSYDSILPVARSHNRNFYRQLPAREKKAVFKGKDELINFGINVYGKNVPFEEYDDEVLANRYKDENDLIFVYKSNNQVKRFIKKNDPMNKLNVKNNKFINNTKESSLFDDI